jgi:hypothetical protein
MKPISKNIVNSWILIVLGLLYLVKAVLVPDLSGVFVVSLVTICCAIGIRLNLNRVTIIVLAVIMELALFVFYPPISGCLECLSSAGGANKVCGGCYDTGERFYFSTLLILCFTIVGIFLSSKKRVNLKI